MTLLLLPQASYMFTQLFHCLNNDFSLFGLVGTHAFYKEFVIFLCIYEHAIFLFLFRITWPKYVWLHVSQLRIWQFLERGIDMFTHEYVLHFIESQHNSCAPLLQGCIWPTWSMKHEHTKSCHIFMMDIIHVWHVPNTCQVRIWFVNLHSTWNVHVHITVNAKCTTTVSIFLFILFRMTSFRYNFSCTCGNKIENLDNKCEWV